MFFSRSNKRESSSLIVFIESGAVRMGIVLRLPAQAGAPNKPPMLVYETVRPFKTAETSDRLIAEMLAALAEACSDVTKEALPHIIARRTARGAFDTAHFVYGAPWYLSRGRKITIESQTPIAYSKASLDALIEEHGVDIIPELHKDAVCIERFATHWSVNGYRITDPVGKMGTRLSLNLFVSAIPAGVKNAVEETIARSFHAHEVSHHSIALAASTTLTRSDDKKTGPLLFIHLSDAITELATVSGDAILDSITFPEGTAHFHAAWSKETGRLLHEAKIPAQRSGVDIPMTDSWQAGIAECLGALLVEQSLPEQIVLLADETVRNQAMGAIRDISTKVFNQAVPVVALTESSFGSSLHIAAGATPGSAAMRLLALVNQ